MVAHGPAVDAESLPPSATPLRPPRTYTATISEVGADDPDAPSAPDLRVQLPSLNLPPASTHLPPKTRSPDRLCRVVLAGHGSGQQRILHAERGTLEVLAGAGAHGSGRGGCRFEDLLRRAEEHLLINCWARGSSVAARMTPSHAPNEPRWTAAVGACRKATTGLVSSMLSFVEREDLSWAKELLQCAALTAPALSGTRAGLPRWVHANKLHAALSALFCPISAGTLPPAAMTRVHAAVLAAQEERQAETHQDGDPRAHQRMSVGVSASLR